MPNQRRLRPWMLVSAAWIVPAILGAINEVAQRVLSGSEPPSMPELLFAGGDWLVYALLTPGVFALSRRFPLARPRLVSHALLHLGFALLFCVAWSGLGTLLRATLTPDVVLGGGEDSTLERALGHFVLWTFITLPFGVAVYLAVVGIEHAVRYFAEVRERELQVARLAEQLSDARFAALQARLNPHFLFNTLNTIAVLVRDQDTAGAARMVEQLSEVLRRILDRHRTSEVTLEEELQLVRQYLAIEQVRFSDRLRVEFEVDADLMSAAVPGFALQHLVENAIRHGIARREDAGRLRIAARRAGASLELTVTDDGPGIDTSVEPPTGHGIESTRERLQALYGERASLRVAPREGGGTIATLLLPYREHVLDQGHGPR